MCPVEVPHVPFSTAAWTSGAEDRNRRAGMALPRLPVEDFLISGHVERFARRHRVTVLDRPGFGYSEWPRKLATRTPRAAA